MENLNIQDGPPPLGAGQRMPMPPAVPQLPPQMFTTAAQLLDLTDSEDCPMNGNGEEEGWLTEGALRE